MLHLKTTIITKGLARMNKRALNRVMKRVWARLGAFWHSHLLKKHFTEAGAAEYQYRKRKDPSRLSWSDVAAQKRGLSMRAGPECGKPLTYSGDLKRMALGERRVSSTSKGCKVKLRLPAYAYYHGMAAELTKVSPKDRKLMIAFARQALVEELKREAQALPERKQRCF